jgi:opacity protein-like surface antigen
MKIKITPVLAMVLALATSAACAQENNLILQGGYAAGNGTASPTGFKINASWEFQPMGDKWTMGGSIGYVKVSAKDAGNNFDVSSVPICFVSRIMFGGEKVKFFVRGSLGTHLSSLSYSGTLISTKDSQWGMAAGLGGGLMYSLSETMFLSADYEWLWLSNPYTNSGSIGTASVGVGFKF